MKAILAASLSLALSLSLGACDMPESDRPLDSVDDCAGPDTSGWNAIGPSSPIMCDGKIVGYQLDLDGTKGPQSFTLVTDAPLPSDRLVSLSARIDTGAGAERSVRMTQDGSALDIAISSAETLEAHAIVLKGPPKVTYVVQVDVPQGIVYRGKITNVRKK